MVKGKNKRFNFTKNEAGTSSEKSTKKTLQEAYTVTYNKVLSAN